MTARRARALITGAGGFIGRALYDYLAGQAVDVYGVDRRPAGARRGDWDVALHDTAAVARVLTHYAPDTIFHLAGAVGTDDEALLQQAHVETTRALLQGVADVAPAARVVIMGSAAEYGRRAAANGLVAEGAAAQPESAYGHSKLAQSQLAAQMAAAGGLDVVRVRLFNTLGPGQGPHLVAGAMIARLDAALQSGAPHFAVYDPYSERDYLDVRDVARLLWLIGQRANVVADPIHLASGVATSVLMLAQGLYAAAGVSEAALPLHLLHADSPTCFVAETDTLTALLHGQPLQQHTIETTLRDMWQWHSAQKERARSETTG